VVISGEVSGLPKKLAKKILDIQQKTSAFNAITVNLCINYGGRQDICQSVKKLLENGEEVTEENIEKHLYNSFLPEPDAIIRTGGCLRLSNFLLYQSAYSELFFTNTLWPDFSNEEYNGILEQYTLRSRNFGALPKK
jgi:undecaprenyl diphosphate synthase